MSDLVLLSGGNKTYIDLKSVKQSMKKINEDYISPAKEVVPCDIVETHAAEPIKSMAEIMRISNFLLENKRYRDNMLFIVGINFGLRVSDLLSLRFCHIINDNYTFKESFAVFEQKTRNTRKKKKNRYLTVNKAVIEAVVTYLENVDNISLSDYMFRGYRYERSGENRPMNARTVNRILKQIGVDLDLPIQLSSHSLRKTFCYHQMVMSNNDPRKLLLLQKMLGHSTSAQTLDYIGITGDEITEAYQKLNLGSKDFNYLVDSRVYEKAEDEAEELKLHAQ